MTPPPLVYSPSTEPQPFRQVIQRMMFIDSLSSVHCLVMTNTKKSKTPFIFEQKKIIFFHICLQRISDNLFLYWSFNYKRLDLLSIILKNNVQRLSVLGTKTACAYLLLMCAYLYLSAASCEGDGGGGGGRKGPALQAFDCMDQRLSPLTCFVPLRTGSPLSR